jgi:multidrug resistance efflux pump
VIPLRKEEAESSKSEEKSGKDDRGRRLRAPLFALLPTILLVGGAGGAIVSTDDAYVEASKIGISTDVSGTIKDVEVRENQQVTAGQDPVSAGSEAVSNCNRDCKLEDRK